MKIKYSIIIPTLNGGKYLAFAMKSVLQSTRKDIELIVSDNCSNDNTEKILSNFCDKRLKIIRPSRRLLMSSHYEFAISRAKGDWVTIIGDDDAIMPYAFDALDKYIKKYPKIDIISSALSFYFWRGCENIYGNKVINYSSKCHEEIRSTKKDLFSVLMGLRSCFDMPQIYTSCIIKRTLFEEIKFNSGGQFYFSINPDMYSAVALCLSRKIYLRVEEPLFWSGVSAKTMSSSNKLSKEASSRYEVLNNSNLKSPKKISDEISFLLFHSNFGQIYFLEALLQCPLSSKNYKNKWIKTIVVASIFFETFKRNKFKKLYLIKEIYLQSRNFKASILWLVIFFILVSITNIINFLLILPNKIFKRIGIFGYLTFISFDRNMFNTIFDASWKIKKLRNFYFKK